MGTIKKIKNLVDFMVKTARLTGMLHQNLKVHVKKM